MPSAYVETAPGKSIVEKVPLLSRNPCVLRPIAYCPTICPDTLIPFTVVYLEPGKSIVVQITPDAQGASNIQASSTATIANFISPLIAVHQAKQQIFEIFKWQEQKVKMHGFASGDEMTWQSS